MFADYRILARHGGCEVLHEHKRSTWPDGTSLALHVLRFNGIDSLFHRAVVLPSGQCIVFDLRAICPPLHAELPATPARDVPGTVDYFLRRAWRDADAALAAIDANALMAWHAAPDTHVNGHRVTTPLIPALAAPFAGVPA